eukprot:TRINITY_DN6113_c0_g1_i4.p1 TRINITY_DN6113_c0_g1~~TRINITY_DN6113_c0_g1_i4.p1  ORF type:complete len:286 (+),score=36.05 TRINITY_DN6113_c0_g1_i4:76-933(+)
MTSQTPRNISNEEELAKQVLTRFYNLSAGFQFSKATDVLKLKTSVSLGPPWTNFLSPLLLLAASENIYYSLTYLEFRWIRKDHLFNMYGQVFSDLNEALKKFKAHEAVSGSNLVFFESLIWQTGLLVGFRSELVSMYRALAASRGSPAYLEFIKHLSTIKKQISVGVNHTLLENVKTNVIMEVSILHDLFRAQISISQYNFLDATLTLYKSKTELDKWAKIYTQLAGGESRLPKTGVVPWIHKFHASLHSKMTFYFYPILNKNETKLGGTMKSFSSKLTVDYHAL